MIYGYFLYDERIKEHFKVWSQHFAIFLGSTKIMISYSEGTFWNIGTNIFKFKITEGPARRLVSERRGGGGALN